jgi:hypothetical protein
VLKVQLDPLDPKALLDLKDLPVLKALLDLKDLPVPKALLDLKDLLDPKALLDLKVQPGLLVPKVLRDQLVLKALLDLLDRLLAQTHRSFSMITMLREPVPT